MGIDRELAASRLRTALDLYAAGEAMMRLKLTRENPSLDAVKVEELLLGWLRLRPGAELGDCPGPSRKAR